jgi:hypothetical protein
MPAEIKIQCECGHSKLISKSNISAHKKSKTHAKNMLAIGTVEPQEFENTIICHEVKAVEPKVKVVKKTAVKKTHGKIKVSKKFLTVITKVINTKIIQIAQLPVVVSNPVINCDKLQELQSVIDKSLNLISELQEEITEMKQEDETKEVAENYFDNPEIDPVYRFTVWMQKQYFNNRVIEEIKKMKHPIFKGIDEDEEIQTVEQVNTLPSFVVELSKPITLKKTRNMLFIELKNVMQIRRGLFETHSRIYQFKTDNSFLTYSHEYLLNEPQYNGNCYGVGYITKYHQRIDKTCYDPSFESIKDDEDVKYWFQGISYGKEFNEENWKIVLPDKYDNLWGKKYRNKVYTTATALSKLYKVRVIQKKLKYNSIITHDYSVLNLKRWNKITNKPTNSGLTARHRTPWHFIEDGKAKEKINWDFEDEALTAVQVEKFAIWNGFKKDILKITNKGKANESIKYKSYQYGEYANYLLEIYGGALKQREDD